MKLMGEGNEKWEMFIVIMRSPFKIMQRPPSSIEIIEIDEIRSNDENGTKRPYEQNS